MTDDRLYPGRSILGRIEPQPPKGIKYMLGNETWLPAHERGLIRLHCEEWGNLGPMEMNPEIKPNKAGFRVRCTTLIAPPGAHGFTEIDGVYFWTDMNWHMKKPGMNSTVPAGVQECTCAPMTETGAVKWNCPKHGPMEPYGSAGNAGVETARIDQSKGGAR